MNIMEKKAFSAKNGLFALGIVGSVIYLSLIFNNNLWVDEAFTACIIRGNFSQMLKGTVSDTLPPFYNIFTWLLTSIAGFNPYIMKLSSVLPMILLLLWLSPFHIAGLYGDRTAAVFDVCIICAPHLIHYGIEIRPYSWGLFFATAAGVFALQTAVSVTGQDVRKNLAGLVVFSALSGYTHQYALIPSAIVWLVLLIHALYRRTAEKNTLKTRFAAFGVFVLAYIPMLVLTIYQLRRAGGYFSMEALTLSTLMSDLRFPYVTNITPISLLLLIAVLVLLVLSITATFKNRRFLIPVLMMAIPYLTLGFGYICSIAAGGNLFTSRYLVPSLGLFWLGAAIAATDAEGLFSSISFKVFPIIMLASLIAVHPQEYQAEYASGVNRMTAYFDENLSPDDGYIIYEDKYQIELCMRYYYPGFKKYDWENAGECSGTLWYFEVPGYEGYLDEAAERGYEAEHISNMSFDRYAFSLYRLKRN